MVVVEYNCFTVGGSANINHVKINKPKEPLEIPEVTLNSGSPGRYIWSEI